MINEKKYLAFCKVKNLCSQLSLELLAQLCQPNFAYLYITCLVSHSKVLNGVMSLKKIAIVCSSMSKLLERSFNYINAISVLKLNYVF